MTITTIDVALKALRDRKPIIVVDDEGRENEGDLIMSAQLATAEWVAFMVRHTSGYICAPKPREIADRLDLPAMVVNNEDPRGTAYTIGFFLLWACTAASSLFTWLLLRPASRFNPPDGRTRD